MGNEINQFPKGNNPEIGRCRRRTEEDLALRLILVILLFEFFFVGTYVKLVLWQDQKGPNEIYVPRVSTNFVLQACSGAMLERQFLIDPML